MKTQGGVWLSLIVPVYNAEKYLADCLDSLLEQGMDTSQYEIICVNDGSTDGSLDILQDYRRRHPNMIVLDSNNSGVSAARNTGMHHAAGKYIAFVDADDMVRPYAYRELVACAERLHAQLILFEFLSVGSEVQAEWDEEINLSPCKIEKIASTNVWRELILNKVIVDHDLKFSPDLNMGEDHWFNEQLMCYLDDDAIFHVPQKLYAYRRYMQSSSQNNKRATIEKKKNSMIRIAELSRDFIANSLTKDTQRLLDRQYESVAAAIVYSLQISPGCVRDTIKRLTNEGLYPYKLTSCFFRKKKSLAKYLMILCRWRIFIDIMTVPLWIRSKFRK